MFSIKNRAMHRAKILRGQMDRLIKAINSKNMMGNYYGNMFGWGLGGGMIMIIFWAAIILFIVWIVREVSGRNNSDKTRHSKSAIEILEERHAKGEVDKKEFEEKKKDLSS